MVSCLGNLGGSLSPVAFGIIVQFSNSWVLPFIIASGMLVVGAALWMFVDPGLSLEVELAELDKRRAAAARA
jgi:MFS family permease